MRRTIQDLVASIDPNVKIDPEVEDVSRCVSPTCRVSDGCAAVVAGHSGRVY